MSVETINAPPTELTSVSVVKTLPMKYKAMHYAIIAFLSSQSNMEEEVKKSLLDNLPIYKNAQEQVAFYESLVDFKKVETDIIKPMQKQKKQDEKEAKKQAEKALKEKKPRAPRKKKEPVIAETKTEGDVPITTDIPQVVEEPNTKKKTTAKKPKVTKKQNEKNEVKEEEISQKLVLENPDEMKEEEYIATTETVAIEKESEKLKKKRFTKKKETKNPSTKEKKEHWMFIRDGSRYWTTDENIENGSVFENIVNEEGDNDSGKAIGSLVNGGLCLNK
jgi:hypothetical protein